MRYVRAMDIPDERLFVGGFGVEDISEQAHWGRGCRDGYLIHYVLEGEGFFNAHRVREHQAFLIKPEQLHEYHSSADKPWKYFWVSFAGDGVEEVCNRYISADETGIFDVPFKSELLSFVDMVFSEPENVSGTKLLGYFYLLMSHHAREPEKKNPYISAAEVFIKMNYQRKITVTEVAEALNISDRYLYNLFVEHTGVSPKKYICDIRLNRAKAMLERTTCSIGEIARTVGFENVLDFSRFFSKSIGLSPSEYRKDHLRIGTSHN